MMALIPLLFLILDPLCAHGFNIFADLYARPKYDVVFSPDGILEADIANIDSGADTTKIMKLGQNSYFCQIPPNNDTETGNTVVPNKADYAKAQSRALELLDLAASPSRDCIYYSTGYWTYEVCFDKSVRQFHSKGIVAGEVNFPEPADPRQTYTLGRFGPTTDMAVRSNGEVAYVSQTLGHGTVCDLTGEERSVELKYYCKPELEDDMVAGYSEVKTCTYEIVIYTPKLCKDPVFLPPKESVSNEITCRKILSQYEQGQDSLTIDSDHNDPGVMTLDDGSIVGHLRDSDPSDASTPLEKSGIPLPPKIDYKNRKIIVDSPKGSSLDVKELSEDLVGLITSLASPIIEDLVEQKVIIDGKVLSPDEDFEFIMALVGPDGEKILDLVVANELKVLYIYHVEADNSDDGKPQKSRHDPKIDYSKRQITIDVPVDSVRDIDDLSEEFVAEIGSLTNPIVEDLRNQRVIVDGEILSPDEDFEFTMTLVDFDGNRIIDLAVVSELNFLYLDLLPDEEYYYGEEEEIRNVPITPIDHVDHPSATPPSPALTKSQTQNTKDIIHDEL